VTTSHLNNRLSKYKPQIKFGGINLEYDQTPKYLGVTLDRQLTYNHHIKNTAAKLKTRNNIIYKLAGSSWGAAMPTLRTSALVLVYSATEYASPVWLNSWNCSKIDVQLLIYAYYLWYCQIDSDRMAPSPLQYSTATPPT